ncbi:hypothetical protein Droror1_Dr00022586 [Drosera rotundifolia]
MSPRPLVWLTIIESSTTMSSNISLLQQLNSVSWLAAAAPYLLSLIAFLMLREQISYLKKKSHIPGPAFVIPFIGSAVSLVRNPTKFWDLQASTAASSPLGICSNYFFGKFIVFIRTTELSHKVLANVRPDAFQCTGHPFGKKLFGEHNMCYMMGDDYKEVRRRIAPNFTAKALSTYTTIQQRVILKHLTSWQHRGLGSSKPVALRPLVRDMNLDTSQTVFVGPYLSQEERRRFEVDYNLFNMGLMTFPIDLPGFGFRNARLAVERLVETLAVCAARSKERILSGVEPECLVDYWMQDTVREEKEAEERGDPPPPHSSNSEIGGHLFDFLFAAQDASTSSLLWAVTLLESHPDALSQVRDEVVRVLPSDPAAPITADLLSGMKYTQAVAREVLRYRTPATLVPHLAQEDFPLTETYTIPKGSFVFASMFESCFQGFTDPYRFDPERFMEARGEGELYKRNFLVFGAGSHQCVGQRYAVNHLVLFIAMFANSMDFKRHLTHGCDDIVYTPTIGPKDGCTLYLNPR